MGGLGSGRWKHYRRKTTVEQCLQLDANKFGIRPKGKATGKLQWGNHSAGFTIETNETGGHLQLAYSINGERYNPNPIPLTTVQLPYRLAWYFICPTCTRRFTKLYKPPDKPFFACRYCHELTYKSAQERDKTIVNTLQKYGGEYGFMAALSAKSDWTLSEIKTLYYLFGNL